MHSVLTADIFPGVTLGCAVIGQSCDDVTPAHARDTADHGTGPEEATQEVHSFNAPALMTMAAAYIVSIS